MRFTIDIIIRCAGVIEVLECDVSGATKVDCELVELIVVGHLRRINMDLVKTGTKIALPKNYFSFVSKIGKISCLRLLRN